MYAALWEAEAEDAEIVDVIIGESDEVVFASVSEMVTFFNLCYQRGAFFLGSNGMLTINPAVYTELLTSPD